MHATKSSKTALATALVAATLGATAPAGAGIGIPQKHPDGTIAPGKSGSIIGVLRHPDIIGVLKHPDRAKPRSA